MVAQGASSAATAVLGLPVAVGLALALWWQPLLAWPVLVLGVLWGALTLVVGVHLGGRVYDARQVWLLSRLR